MKITVRLFAIARERAGVGEVALEVAEAATVAAAAEAVVRQFPSIAELMPRVAFAVNREYAPLTARLNEGDEVAVIPPVSGG